MLLLYKIIEYKYNNLNIVEGIISLNLSIFCKLIIYHEINSVIDIRNSE